MPCKTSSDFGLFRDGDPMGRPTPKSVILRMAVVAIMLLMGCSYIVFALFQNECIPRAAAVAEELRLPSGGNGDDDPPEPFRMRYRGSAPAVFAQHPRPTSAADRPQAYPRNIQEMLGLLESSAGVQSPQQAGGRDLPPNDPFSSFKPQNPGDVNLLATASFRFAPPLWKTLTTNRVQQQHVARPAVPEPIVEYLMKQPIMLTVNVHPSEADLRTVLRQLHRPLSHRMEGADLPVRNADPTRIVIHMNIYPEGMHENRYPLFRMRN